MNNHVKSPKPTPDQRSILKFMKDFTGQSSSSPKTKKKHERVEQNQEEWELIKRKQERVK